MSDVLVGSAAGVSRAALGGRSDGERRRVSAGLTGPPPPHGRTVRLLDISEQPAAGAPGKRRRKVTGRSAGHDRESRALASHGHARGRAGAPAAWYTPLIRCPYNGTVGDGW